MNLLVDSWLRTCRHTPAESRPDHSAHRGSHNENQEVGRAVESGPVFTLSGPVRLGPRLRSNVLTRACATNSAA